MGSFCLFSSKIHVLPVFFYVNYYDKFLTIHKMLEYTIWKCYTFHAISQDVHECRDGLFSGLSRFRCTSNSRIEE